MRKLSNSDIILEAASFGLAVSAEEEYILNRLSTEERPGVYKFEIMKIEERERRAERAVPKEEKWRELIDTKTKFS